MNFIVLVSVLFVGSATCLDLFRNIWRSLNRESSNLFDEMNRVDEEIRAERLFINGIVTIMKEMEIIKVDLEKLNVKEINFTKLNAIKESLDEKYVGAKEKLLDQEKLMESLWLDDEFRIVFDLAMKLKLLEPNRIEVDLDGHDKLREAVKIRNQLIKAEHEKAVVIETALSDINRQASRIDGLFSQIDFYEACRDRLEALTYNPEISKAIREFESRQVKKTELMNGVREVTTVRRVNRAIDGTGEWKMRIFGMDGGKAAITGHQDPIISAEVLKYSRKLSDEENAAKPPEKEIDLMVRLMGKYAQYTEKIYNFFSDATITEAPKTFIEELIDAVRLSE